jgi:hypothetical protein
MEVPAELGDAERIADVVYDAGGEAQQVALGRADPVKGLLVRRRAAAHGVYT